MSADSRLHLPLPGPAVGEHSPLTGSSLASDLSAEDQFNTPRPYVDASPLPVPPHATLRRSTSAPYQPSLSSFHERALAPRSRQTSDLPAALPHLTEQSPPRPHLSLTINQSDDSAVSSSPQPGSATRKSRSYSQSSPTSAGPSTTSSLVETPSPLVELSPMCKRLKARAARALSVGSARPQLSRTYSPARSAYSPPVELKEDGGRATKDVIDISSPFEYWAMDDDSLSDVDEAATPPALTPTRYPSLRSIYRISTREASTHCPSVCAKPQLYRCCGRALRCGFFSMFVIAFLLFGLVMLVQFRGATLYSNAVCTPLDTSVTTATTASNLAYQSVIKTQTTLPKSKVYVVFWNMLNAFFGVFSFVRYSATSFLTAATRRIRVPTVFNSSAPLFTPNYTGSPLLSLPLNHFRLVGSHNSYHMKSSYPIPAHQYAHAPLPAQLGDYSDGVRQIELDIHVLEGKGGNVLYHVQLVDDHTNCYCLTECLLLVREWSRTYTLHYPVMLMLEFKRQAYEDMMVSFNGLTCNDLYNLEVALLDVFPPGSFLLPRDVRGSFPNLLSALTYRSYLDRKTNRWNTTSPSMRPTPAEDAEMAPLAQYAATNVSFGWPSMGSMLGRLMFVWLDDVFNYADRLSCVRDDPSSQNIAMFIAQAKWNQTYSAIQVNRDPLVDWNYNQIQKAIDHGLIIRSLSTTAQVSRRDTRRYEAALRYGLHYLSSDFEAPCAGNMRTASNMTVSTARGGDAGQNVSIASWSDENKDHVFCERLPSGWPFECHPMQSPPWCVEELNRIRVGGLAAASRMNATEMDRMRLERERVAALGTEFLGMDIGLG